MEGPERSESRGELDKDGFAIRRELRDTLSQLIEKGWWLPGQFEDTVDRLGQHRQLAIRQIVSIFREGRVSDEVAALEVLGRLVQSEDIPLVAAIANEADMPESLRVACGLVLLGRDCADQIRCSDLSGMVLRWQARYLAEEPGLRDPLCRLYEAASREDRAKWVLLQDEELEEPEGRAAVFEMLLETEDDFGLRSMLLDGLARTHHPCARASLRRVRPRRVTERDVITTALAGLAVAGKTRNVPEGWQARVGYCDGAGSFALRFDRCGECRRPRSAVFVLDVGAGIREALGLTGSDVARYDRWPDADPEEIEPLLAEASPRLHPLPVPVALGMLAECERLARATGRSLPADYAIASRLLDPLADVDPVPAPAPAECEAEALADEAAARLLAHPGYVGWFYDAGDHLLDDLRLTVLDEFPSSPVPSPQLITRAARRLAGSGEGVRLAARLRHNAIVHRCAGETELERAAMALAAACEQGPLEDIPLVRQMLQESLHPGHYFFAPIPDTTSREDLAVMLLRSRRPSRRQVLSVDLAWILGRAGEVWLSRLPSPQRAHGDEMQRAVLAAAEAAAAWIARWWPAHADEGEAEAHRVSFGHHGQLLRRQLVSAIRRSGLRAPAADPGFGWLSLLLLWAAETLVFRICLGQCPMRCPAEPRRSGRPALDESRFPAGDEAETIIRSWPGLFVKQPSPEQERALSELVCGRTGPATTGTPCADDECFECSVCREFHPNSMMARGRLQPLTGGPLQPVCTECQARYREDPSFEAEILRTLGRLIL